MKVDLSTIMSVISLIGVLFTIYKTQKNDIKNDNEQLIRISVQLENLQKTMEETRTDIKTINDKLIEVLQTQVNHAGEIKALWRSVTDIEEFLGIKKEVKKGDKI